MILIAAMRDFMLEQQDDETAKSLEHDFLFPFVRRSRELTPKLSLNVDDNEFFKNRILRRPSASERKTAQPKLESHRLIESAACKAAERVQTIIRGHGDADARLNDWIDYLEKSAIVLSLRVPTEMDAYKMFETLNDRGLRTTQSDMLKNYLFRQVKDDGLTEAQQKWSAMRASLESLGIEEVTLVYLRHITLAILGPNQSTEKVGFYDRITKEFRGKSKSLSFLDSLAKYADDYAAALTPTHSKWNTYPGKITEAIQTMRELNVVQIRPLMVAVTSHFSPKDAEQAFRAFVCWTVRFMIVGGMRGQSLEDAYADRAHKIVTGKIATFSALRDSMKTTGVVPNDLSFHSQFAVATVSKGVLARYYLRALEARVRDETPFPEVMPIQDPTILNLEHILPQKPENNWSHLTKEVAESLTNRIGNLVLMNSKKNSLIGNMPFKDKRNVLKESQIVLTRQIYQTTRPTTLWGTDEITARQKKLAELAVKTWPL